MLEWSKKIWFFIIMGGIILLNLILIATEKFAFLLAPLILVFAYLALFKLDVLYKWIIFFVPISVSLLDLDIEVPVNMSLPTEPILFGILILFIVKILHEGGFDHKVLKHPVTVVLFVHLAWIFITIFPSVKPLVSIKFFVVQLWFLATFYFIATQVFKNQKNFNQFFWLYISGFFFVIFYTIIKHAFTGFDHQSANWVMNPFFDDHTSYGACLAFVFPFLTAKLFNKQISGTKKLLIILLYALYLFALITCYTRAAWLSLIGALVLYVILKFKIRWWVITAGSLVGLVVVMLSWNQLYIALQGNKTDSSTDLKEHVASSYNMSSDASNLERINRWKSAYSMFKERPVFGFGPGTYAFEYAPFQKSSDKTIISTNSGDGGNAHSEYLGPLSERGILGALTTLALFITIFHTGLKVYKRIDNQELKIIALCALLALVTYFIHGGLNNFLDQDKVAAPFWGFTAMLVVLDCYFLPQNEGVK